ncbi:MAG TPA: hotdog domain-containing protein [Nannocystaceae bacterium]|nr:hotdog domain-containing protein [Nannocystaceae bacterium]
MQPGTHEQIDHSLCGRPLSVGAGHAEVELVASDRMRVDASGLVHGGFVFGAADHAAMLAIGAPTVVLGSADVRFLAPVKVGERVLASARLDRVDGKKHMVEVIARTDAREVLRGVLTCFVPARHVLEADDARR